MAKIIWDNVGEKLFETGVSKGVLYKPDSTGAYVNGVGWNGLTAVNEAPETGDASDYYANNVQYGSLLAAEKFKATIEAYTYPEEFEECDGSATIAKGVLATMQTRKPFGFAYRTEVGNDTKGLDYGYKIHLVYGCKASASSKDHGTINESPEMATMSWELSTTPVPVPNLKPTAHLIIDSHTADATKLAALEDILYGSDETNPRLPLPAEVITLMSVQQAKINLNPKGANYNV